MIKAKQNISTKQIQSYKRLANRLIKEEIPFNLAYNDDEIQVVVRPLVIDNQVTKLLRPWPFIISNSTINVNIKEIEA